MSTNRITLLSFTAAFSSLILLGSCRPDPEVLPSGSGLVPGGDYRSTAVQYDKPFRMFTHDGEIVNQAAISNYTTLHASLIDIAFTPDTSTPLQVLASQTQVVYHNGASYNASVQNGIFDMRQPDTSMYSESNPGRNIDFLFAIEQSYDTLKHQALEMHDSYTRVERTAFDSYRGYHSYHITGTYANAELVLPYTLFATRLKSENYLFALKANPAPQVPLGDTVLVREGRVAFHLR